MSEPKKPTYAAYITARRALIIMGDEQHIIGARRGNDRMLSKPYETTDDFGVEGNIATTMTTAVSATTSTGEPCWRFPEAELALKEASTMDRVDMILGDVRRGRDLNREFLLKLAAEADRDLADRRVRRAVGKTFLDQGISSERTVLGTARSFSKQDHRFPHLALLCKELLNGKGHAPDR